MIFIFRMMITMKKETACPPPHYPPYLKELKQTKVPPWVVCRHPLTPMLQWLCIIPSLMPSDLGPPRAGSLLCLDTRSSIRSTEE